MSAKLRRAERHNGIVEEVEGTRRFSNGKFAIFIVWQPKGIPWYVRNALDALEEVETNVVVVANHELSPELREDLAAKCHTILVRDNTGFDIGGYKDATLYALDNLKFDRLFYLNDSIYFFKEGLTDLFSRMVNSTADLCTAFENWEFRYHIQSFCFSISSKLGRHPKYAAYWRDYLPVSARRWAIHKGEIALSKKVIPLADTLEVVYSPNDIRPFLKNVQISDLPGLNAYLPRSQRLDASSMRMARSRTITDEILQRVAVRSQIHTGGFLYHRFLKCPIIKRDLVYRLQFSVYDVELALYEAAHGDHVEEILSDLRRKGPGTQLPLLKRLQFLDGII